MRNGVARVLQQSINDSLSIVMSRSRIPQTQWCDPVSVNVLRCALKFGEWCNRMPTLIAEFVIDFEK
jgi:hypothetical protein